MSLTREAPMIRAAKVSCVIGLIFFGLADSYLVRPALAQSAPPTEGEVRQLFAALEIQRQYEQMIPGIAEQTWKLISPRVPDLPDDLRATLQDEMKAEFLANSALFIEALIPIYQRHLTGEEAVALMAFMKTPAGKSLTMKMPKIQVEGFQVGAQIGGVLGRKAGESAIKKLRAKGYNL
jgi:hypothetical protein